MKKSFTTLSLSFAFLIALMIFLSVIGIKVLQSNMNRIDTLVHTNNLKTSLITTMHISARDRILNLQTMVGTNDPFIRDGLWMKFNAKGTDFIVARTKLVNMDLSIQERTYLDKQDVITQKLGPLQNKIAQYSIDEEISMARDLIISEAIPLQNQALEYFNEILKLQQASSMRSVEDASRDYNTALITNIGISIGLVLLSIFIAAFVTRRIAKTENKLNAETERALVTLHSIGDGVVTTDINGNIQQINDVAAQLSGWDCDVAMNRSITEVFNIIDETDPDKIIDPLESVFTKGIINSSDGQSVLLNREGIELAIEHTSSPIMIDDGPIIGAIVVFKDVTEMRALSHQLSYQASHDALTGLHNRREFENALEHALAEVRRYHDTKYWLCFIDMDQFKIVNDTCGHIAGDELLKQVSMTLKNQIREVDQVARMGGDEFAILFGHCDDDNAEKLVERIRASIHELRFYWDDKSFDTSASIGLVPINADSGSLHDVMSAADTACYISKDSGRNKVHIYQASDEVTSRHEGEMAMVHRINNALEQNRFAIHAQRIHDAQDTNDRSIHAEILVRMFDEQGEMISPVNFIPAAERYHLMTKVDRWVIERTFKEIQLYIDTQSGISYTISINLSAQSIGDAELLDFIRNALTEYKIDPMMICFEVTETSAIANLSSAMVFINTLKDIGCRFSLDDFGSGLSSFGYLKNLPVDYLKIDGSFIRDILDDPMDMALVESINQIGHVLGVKTIAEYVDSKEKLMKLKTIGLDYVQGFYLHKPQLFKDLLEKQSFANELHNEKPVGISADNIRHMNVYK